MRRAALGAFVLCALVAKASALDAELRKRAKDPDASERVAAARALAKENSADAARVLVELMSDRMAKVRDAAVLACGNVTDAEAVKAIASNVRAKDELDRRNCAEALGRTRCDAAIDALESLALRDPSPQVRADALDALGRFEGHRSVLGIASKGGSDKHALVRAAAVETAGRAGGAEALPHVRRALADADDGVRCVARAALVRVARDEALAGLADAAKDESWRVRAQCVDDAMSLREAAAMDALVTLVGDDVVRVAAAAHRALQRLSGKELGRDRDLWNAWWDAQRATWTPPKGDAAKEAADDPKRTTASYHGVGVATGAATFVADLSGSMTDPVGGPDTRTRWAVAAQELRTTLASLPDGFVVNLVFFQNLAHKAFEKPQTLTKGTRERAEVFVNSGSPGQAGDLLAGVLAALDDDEIDTVFLLSDGEPSWGDFVDRGRVRAAIRQRNRMRKCVIDSIGFGAKKALDRGFMEGVAKDSGGRAVFRGEGEK